MRITLERVTPNRADVRRYLKIGRTAVSKTFLFAESEHEAKADIKKATAAYFILADGERAGIISYRRGESLNSERQYAYIEEVVVTEAWQGRKVGNRALRKILSETASVDQWELHTHPSNTPALRLYLKHGFVIDTWHENFFGDGEPRLLLIREPPSLIY